MRVVTSPRDYVTANAPARVWVTRADQTRLEVTGPRVLGDTLVGFVNGEFRELPLSSATRIEARQTLGVRTGLLAAGVGVAIIGAAYFISGNGARDPSKDPVGDEGLRPRGF
jgi:hypothetical protein